MTILEEIAAKTKERIAEAKQKTPTAILQERAYALADREKEAHGGFAFPFQKALSAEGISFICEIKKASPSKGLIAEDFPYMEIARAYEAAGASAISVLTEPFWFKGSDRYVEEIARKVSLPVLRKDFTVDEYMLYEAKLMGAGAVLLICAITDGKELARYLTISHALGLSALVEAHDERELDTALNAGAGIVGVNNRNLHDFTVDIGNSERLRKRVPKEILFVSESGIKTNEQIEELRKNNVNAVLIGETFMKSEDKIKELQILKGIAK